ncbi:MAG: DUF3822 family protein, partial [Mucilaginibacter polytrichastri]|nr:DUF3822 family protein [Mucilaginibacter polytrichastri]
MSDQSAVTSHQPAFIAHNGESWAITYPVQPNQDPITGHAASLEEFLGNHSAPVFASVKEASFYLIPDEVYDENTPDTYARFLMPAATQQVLSAHWPDANCRLIYTLDESVLADRVSVFPAGLTVSTALKDLYGQTGDSNFVILGQGEVCLFFYRQNKLVFYNRFAFENYDELAYYTLQAIKQSDVRGTVKLLAEGY